MGEIVYSSRNWVLRFKFQEKFKVERKQIPRCARDDKWGRVCSHYRRDARWCSLGSFTTEDSGKEFLVISFKF